MGHTGTEKTPNGVGGPTTPRPVMSKQHLMTALVALAAVAIATRISFTRNLVIGNPIV